MSNVFPISAAPIFDPPRGRPGDWSEPVDMPGIVAEALDAEAARLRLPPDLVAALLVERALLLEDLARAGLSGARAQALLDQAAARVGAALGPGNLFFRYVRDLRSGFADETSSAVGRPLMLPLRLHEPLRRLECGLDTRHADQARNWEMRAANESVFVREWGLRVALIAR